MNLENKTIFVSGANRGIGKALVEALLSYPVKKIYAGARILEKLPNFGDDRVIPIKLDITDKESIKKAAEIAKDVDVLINNAGVLSFSDVVTSESDILMHDMNVNYFGTMNMVHAFVPVIEKKGSGAIANIVSIVGLASMPGIGGYSASKAALFSATQAMRAELKAKNISVHAIFPGPIDTDMSRSFQMSKTSAKITAENIIQGMIKEQEDIFPDPMSIEVGKLWATNPKALERQMTKM